MLCCVLTITRKMQQTGCSEENNQFIELNSWKKSRNEHMCRDWPSKMTHKGTIAMSLPKYFGSFLYFCICTVGQDTAALPGSETLAFPLKWYMCLYWFR